MKAHTRCAISLLLVPVLFLQSGCAMNDRQATQAGGTALGALGGAVLGVGVAALMGGNRDAMVRAAIVGGTIGGKLGYDWGTRVADRKAHYVRAEQWLDHEIGLARQANNRALAYNQSLQRQVAAARAHATAARRSGNAGAIRQAKAEVAQAQRGLAAQNQKEVQYNQDQTFVKSDSKARGASNFGTYKQETSKYNNIKAERGRLQQELASLDNSLDG